MEVWTTDTPVRVLCSLLLAFIYQAYFPWDLSRLSQVPDFQRNNIQTLLVQDFYRPDDLPIANQQYHSTESYQCSVAIISFQMSVLRVLMLIVFGWQWRRSLAVMVTVKVMTQCAYLMSVAVVVLVCSVNFTFSRRSAEGPLVTSSRYRDALICSFHYASTVLWFCSSKNDVEYQFSMVSTPPGKFLKVLEFFSLFEGPGKFWKFDVRVLESSWNCSVSNLTILHYALCVFS